MAQIRIFPERRPRADFIGEPAIGEPMGSLVSSSSIRPRAKVSTEIADGMVKRRVISFAASISGLIIIEMPSFSLIKPRSVR